MSIIGKCFLNAREISNDTFTQLTNDAVNSSLSTGIFETLKIQKYSGSSLIENHCLRFMRGVEALSSELNICITQDRKDQLVTNFRQTISILSRFTENDHAVIRYQLLLNQESGVFTNLIQVRNYELICETISLILSNYSLPRNLNSDGRKNIDRRVYDNAKCLISSEDVYDVILRDQNDHIVEGTKTNVFTINENKLITPDLAQGGVAGVMRQFVIDIALGLNLNVSVAPLSEEDFLSADVVFATNAVIGIVPVDTIYLTSKKSTKYVLKTQSSAFENLIKLKEMVSNIYKINA